MENIDIKHLAELSRIAVPESALPVVEQKIKNILNFVDKIQKVELGPQGEITPEFYNICREDEVNPIIPGHNLVEAAPAHEAGFVKVPKVIG
jgi:aspartyl-tRNA(Asn)/glutamyl-tRNA(Gln) amidotransferase subunit C